MKRFRPGRGPTFAAIICISIALALGFWQIKRLHWKENLLAGIRAQMAQRPVPLPAKIEHPDKWKYRRVTVAGAFMYDHEFLVKPRIYNGQDGFHIVTPVQRISGGIVLVDRGWASAKTLKQVQRPQGLMKVEGIVRIPKKEYFTPSNVPSKNEWYWIDIKAMAKAAGIKGNVLPVVLVATAKKKGGYPIGGKVRIDIPNHHKQYLIFWFCLAGILLIYYVLASMKEED